MRKFIGILFLMSLSSILCYGFFSPCDAEADKIQGVWLNEEGTAQVQIYRAVNGSFAGKYYGKIIWLKVPNEDGKPKVDKNNPDKSKQTTPLMGLLLLKDFTYDSDDKEWSDGTIYDPKNGKTYSSYMAMDGNKLSVRGYIGISILGRTTVWTRVK